MSNTFDKLSVLDSFIEEVNSYLPEIEANLKRLTQSPGDMDALEETFRRTHTIGGSASMMDFPGLAHVAHGMEDILGDVSDGLTTLDQPTIELLQRSLARLHRLVGGIQHGIDEKAIMDEDDDDFARYRAEQDAAAQGVAGGMITPDYVSQSGGPFSTAPGNNGMIGSLDEMLASFQAPQSVNGEVSWPEEPVARPEFSPRADVRLSSSGIQAPSPVPYDIPGVFDAPPPPTQPSALELLANSRRPQEEAPAAYNPSAVPLTPRPRPQPENEPTFPITFPTPLPPQPVQPPIAPAAFVAPTPVPAQPSTPSVRQEHTYTPPQEYQYQEAPGRKAQPEEYQLPASYQQQQPAYKAPQMPQAPVPVQPQARDSALSSGVRMPAVPASSDATTGLQLYQAMQVESQSLADQVNTLRRTLAQLRQAASIIEVQRAEFKGFLDGSRDALSRMEDWAGKAMGLNLRNSPEQVRRYLPLSVMWVANSKLKKVLDMLLQMSNGAEGSGTQLDSTLQQLQQSIVECGDFLQTAPPETQTKREESWSPWELQSASDANQLLERVTFERQGNLSALRAEIEAQVRAELEQQIREEMRAERASTSERVVSGNLQETPEEMEMRLRHDIEIEVRREFLTQLTGEENGGHLPPSLALQYPQNIQNASAAPLPIVTPPSHNSPQVLTQAEKSSAMSSDFGDEATEIFRLEAEEHLQTISMHVNALEHAPTNLEPIQGIRRATHTLKGAAGMMGFRAIADLCHVSEDMLDGVMEGGISISPTVLSLILDTAEALDLLINGKGSPAENENAVQSLRVRYQELLGEQANLADSREEDLEEIEEEHDTGRMPVASVVDSEAPAAESALPGTARADLSVRVSLSKLDELVNLFGELLVNRTILEERIQRLNRLVADAGVSSNRLRDVGQRLESRFEVAMLPSGHSVQVMPGEGDQSLSTLTMTGTNGKNNAQRALPSYLADFDALELDRYTEFHQLARGLSEGISDMSTLSAEMEAVIRDCESVFGRESRLSTTFQDRLMKARLVPLSTMIPRLYRTARAVALKQHKEFELVLEGQETEVDRTVIEEIAGPLLHLMRNAVNHALETPEVRMQRGKPSAGQIKLSASYEGNQVVITVRDDGTGIDPERIRNEAIHRGLIRHNQVLSDGEIIDLIFRPGFSTAEVLSEESGRGVGLDVVRDSVSRLRGSMEVESMPGQGTAFTMKFPTSLAIQNAMMVQVADQQFAIPTVVVEAIGRLDNFRRTNYGGRPAVLVQNQPYPLTSLAQLLGLRVSEMSDKAPLLLVRTDRHRVALVVDDIKGRLDVVIKNLGPHLRNVHGIAGGTVLGNGRVVLILELLDLLATRGGIRGALTAPAVPEQESVPGRSTVQVERRSVVTPPVPSAPKPEPIAPQGKHILVVDDSPSVRRVVSNMLKQHQWEVQTARDGVEALEMIAQETPVAVLLDIEMPRMDGYELMATVRSQEQYRTLPLVVLTSRAASKHQQRAMQLGADAYVVKPYQDEELLNVLKRLVHGASV